MNENKNDLLERIRAQGITKPNWFKRHKKLAIILSITAVVIIGGGVATALYFLNNKPAPAPEKEPEAAPSDKPNFNLDNIQFEFNSFVLKTSSFSILDKAVAEMKKAPNTQFILHGHSSAEGSPEHNMSLSVDRANAVKSYFVNAGLNADRFTIVGHGEKEPISTNNNEEGRTLNRRTEIRIKN